MAKAQAIPAIEFHTDRTQDTHLKEKHDAEIREEAKKLAAQMNHFYNFAYNLRHITVDERNSMFGESQRIMDAYGLEW